MDWLNKLFKPKGSASGDGANILWLYVQCGRCGTPVATRINLFNDLSLDESGNGYVLRKEIMDDKCFRLMAAELEFDEGRHLLDRRIEGGKFLTRADYDALRAERQMR